LGTALHTVKILGALSQGNNAAASGTYAHAQGNNTTASGPYAHAQGNSTLASGQSAHAEGESTTASAFGSHAEGRSSVAAANVSHAQGQYAKTTVVGQDALASGTFAAAGDAQASVVTLMNSTTDATPTVLVSNVISSNGTASYSGSGQSVVVAAASTGKRVRITAVARNTGADEVASFAIDLTLARGASGNIRIVGSQLTSGSSDAAASTWTLVASVDTTNQALVLTATGEATKTIRWVTRVEMVEVG
jgi:hypothetical protein